MSEKVRMEFGQDRKLWRRFAIALSGGIFAIGVRLVSDYSGWMWLAYVAFLLMIVAFGVAVKAVFSDLARPKQGWKG